MNLDLWIPSLFDSKGGIQSYSSYLFNSLKGLYPHSHFNVFLKNDIPKGLPVFNEATKFYASGSTPVPLRTLDFAFQVVSNNIRQPADLIISTHLNFTIAAYLLNKLKGIPYWTIAHGIEAWDIQNPLLKLALRNSDRILAVSHYTRERLLKEQNLNPERVLVLPNTFDSDRFQPKHKPEHLLEKHQLNYHQPIILTVARLDRQERYKGYDQILKALPQIRQSIPDIHYVLVGKGEDRLRIEGLINKFDLQDCVTLAGFISDEQLCDYYNLCDVFAMPSKKEGFGIVYLEALSCGKPVLGGNQDGTVDALCHGELGALVNPDDVAAIVETLIQILNKSYPHALMHSPTKLRQKTIESYGLETFQEKIADLMKFHRQGNQM
jgi:glycosyltransferase involved in cell wall biosynthesis